MSVSMPTMNSRLTIAPNGVTTYEGAFSPSPLIFKVEALNSDAKTRQAGSVLSSDLDLPKEGFSLAFHVSVANLGAVMDSP